MLKHRTFWTCFVSESLHVRQVDVWWFGGPRGVLQNLSMGPDAIHCHCGSFKRGPSRPPRSDKGISVIQRPRWGGDSLTSLEASTLDGHKGLYTRIHQASIRPSRNTSLRSHFISIGAGTDPGGSSTVCAVHLGTDGRTCSSAYTGRHR